jgi:putative membrane protein
MTAAEEPAWRHLHPLTPWFRGGVTIVVIIGALFNFAQQNLLEAIEMIRTAGVIWLILGILAIAALVTGYSLVWWHFARFRVTADKVELRTGFIFRQQRSFRLDQLEAVDVVHPLVARLFGLAKLTMESAGGKDSNLQLSYLTKADAERLRADLLTRRAFEAPVAATGDLIGAAASALTDAATDMITPTATISAEEQPLFQVPPKWTIQAFARSIAPWLTAVFGLGGTVVVLVLAFVIGPEVLGGLVLGISGIFAVGSMLKKRIIDELWFTAFTHPDGLRLRHGLTTTINQTIPAKRIQAVRLSQPLLWRKPDWWRIEINVAGYGDSSKEVRTTLVPVADPGLAALAIGAVMAEAAAPETWELVDQAMHCAERPEGFIGSSAKARTFDPLTWTRNGYTSSDFALVIRRGRLQRQVEIVPHTRIQLLALQQGPLDRYFGLTHVWIHSMPGPISPCLPHLDAADAAAFLEAEAPRIWFPQVVPAVAAPRAEVPDSGQSTSPQ